MNFSSGVDNKEGLPLGRITRVNTAPSHGNPPLPSQTTGSRTSILFRRRQMYSYDSPRMDLWAASPWHGYPAGSGADAEMIQVNRREWTVL